MQTCFVFTLPMLKPSVFPLVNAKRPLWRELWGEMICFLHCLRESLQGQLCGSHLSRWGNGVGKLHVMPDNGTVKQHPIS